MPSLRFRIKVYANRIKQRREAARRAAPVKVIVLGFILVIWWAPSC